MTLDQKNCMILNLLQQDCRMSLTKIAKEVGLSVDSVRKRIKKLVKDKVFFPKIQLRPRHFGFNNIVEIKIKLHNYSDKDMKEFVEYLQNHTRVTEIFSLTGEWDFSIVLIAKDGEDLAIIAEQIRNKFSNLINSWSESFTKVVHKFETYDMLKLHGHDKAYNDKLNKELSVIKKVIE